MLLEKKPARPNRSFSKLRDQCRQSGNGGRGSKRSRVQDPACEEEINRRFRCGRLVLSEAGTRKLNTILKMMHSPKRDLITVNLVYKEKEDM